MIMDQVLGDGAAQVVLPEEDHLVQALHADRFHEALGVGVQIGTSRDNERIVPDSSGIVAT